jgi:S1-C subfamily serine protease
VGTGFFVNDAGDTVTASHVVSDVRKLSEQLKSLQVPSVAELLIEGPNARDLQLQGLHASVPFSVLAMDQVHDLAVLTVTPGNWLFLKQSFWVHPQQASTPGLERKIVTLDLSRPRDGKSVFVCGYPLGTQELVTTSGHIASAWDPLVLLVAQQSGSSERTDVYKLDLLANPGNSGSPVFDVDKQAVIGAVVELRGSIGVAVSATHIVDLLRANRRKWSEAPTPAPVAGHQP